MTDPLMSFVVGLLGGILLMGLLRIGDGGTVFRAASDVAADERPTIH